VSIAPLETLVRHQRALIDALDAEDATAIETASREMEEALVRIRAAAPHGLETKVLAEESLRLADAARARVNVLADDNGRRITGMARATGAGSAAPVYGRNARMIRG
jgi:hypothetical protein